ncbi:hypothetical protein SYYSPA8_09245 [Streptomyces yaizuensis]|uniref:Peptidoglycan binding domain-containing protein n=1 Tax=Streptomyces yaizuensis TaxID=2989713 RepID=A0ABQ5NVS9_9ACTN|nr:hypothetical protein SYYSPA8_09245 [Streptomyces sp. YSPA8]
MSRERQADGAKPEPKTETTVTTRIRINIPGSRPIPPVVMRKPVGDSEPSATAESEPERTAAMPVIGGGQAPAAEPPPQERAPANDWFAPRKGSTNGAGIPTGGAAPGLQGAPGAHGAPGGGIPAQGTGPAVDPLTAPLADALAAPAAAPLTDPLPDPLTDPLAAPLADPLTDPLPGGAPAGSGLPYFSDAPQPQDTAPRSALSDLAGDSGPAAPSGAPAGFGGTPQGGHAGPAGPDAPTGATSGPAKGSMPIRQRMGAGASATAGAGASTLTGAPGGPGGPGGAFAGAGVSSGADAFGGSAGHAGPGGQAGPGGTPQRRAAAPRMSDDTAVLTPQKPFPAPPGAEEPVSGDTLTSGLPVVPADGPGAGPRGPRTAPGFPAGPGGPGGPGAPGGPGGVLGPGMASGGTPAAPKPRPGAVDALPPAPRPPQPAKKKGRSKLVLLGVAVVGLAGVAYGAGLLLNHSEVPKRTTVLGVDIGGGTREQAVVKLEKALGKRAATPLQLSVGDKNETLAPDKAGLVLDSQATVRKAAGSDYNPISVIGSLFGGQRVVEPVIPVDEEKLGVALADLGGSSGSAVEGTITFSPGRATAVPGRAGQALDVDRSMLSVKDAYRAQVETGRSKVVRLPIAKREPTIGQAELDRAMKEFAEPAMSAEILIRAGGREIPFGPAISLPQILSMKAVDGKLVAVYDKKAIEQLVGSRFAGVMVTKGGKQEQLGADDIAEAMGPALRGKTSAERVAEIELNGG